MTYKETLFFIGRCLTISLENNNRVLVENDIKSGKVDWDNTVKLSTAHYVFPALYCNLKRANLLSFLPEDLVNYMQHITNLNRERNQQIITQAKELNKLLLTNNITPIFLKGTGNLLEGLYEDIAERMVGDIDFIVSKEEYKKAAEILLKNGYSKIYKSNLRSHRHFDRIQKKDRIAAVEIHRELLRDKYTNEFNYNLICKETQTIGKLVFLSYPHQLSLSIIAYQINDHGHYYNTIPLRNAYDVFLLSQKTNSLEAIKKFKKFFTPLHHFLAICSKVLSTKTIKYEENKSTKKIFHFFEKLITNSKFEEKHYKKIRKKLFFKSRISIVLNAFYKKEYSIWLIKRIIRGRQKQY